MSISRAPWTPEQVASLQLRQDAGIFHEYTCPNHSDHRLTPTAAGWVCEVAGCDYAQDWAHRADTELTEEKLWRMRLPD